MTHHYHKPTTLAAWHACSGDQTLRLAFPLNRDSRVIDIGAFVGEWALAITQRYGCWVQCYEPLEWAADVIERRKNEANVAVHRRAVTSDGRSVQLVDRAEGSFLDGGMDIQSDSIVDVIDGRADLIKLNVEGTEYELLAAAAVADAIRDVRLWLIQFHGNAPYARDSSVELLGNTHRLMWAFPGVWEAWEFSD